MAAPATFTDLAATFGISLWLLIIILIWIVIWKAIALWKAARKGSWLWFVILLLVNTLGILEILYIFLFSKINLEKSSRPSKKKRRK